MDHARSWVRCVRDHLEGWCLEHNVGSCDYKELRIELQRGNDGFKLSKAEGELCTKLYDVTK